ncbi:MAG: hypothetical protein CL503_06145 [Actinobacteria bacterium]|nr:hypothetical protein [Actinomycetota bacterium]|tara:strand:- start:14518 stop:14943 length:426 start_codon:yes stop_codon:yes gene_type:complete
MQRLGVPGMFLFRKPFPRPVAAAIRHPFGLNNCGSWDRLPKLSALNLHEKKIAKEIIRQPVGPIVSRFFLGEKLYWIRKECESRCEILGGNPDNVLRCFLNLNKWFLNNHVGPAWSERVEGCDIKKSVSKEILFVKTDDQI